MNKMQRKIIVDKTEQQLDSDLDFELFYSLDDYHSNGVSIIEISIDIGKAEQYPDDFDEKLEELVSDIIDENSDNGWYSWDGWTLCISIPD